ncbi:MAG: hypothetical protein JO148_01585, partial [Acidimicrobiia bacterium]|nr:hypothetical protein [Acidimicrobiia bacterium]
MSKSRTLKVAVAVVLGAGIALALPQLAAVSASSPPLATAVTLGNTGTVGARGAVATVTVTVTCPVGAFTQGNVQLNERVGKKIASGYAYLSNIVCDGTPHDQAVTVIAQNAPFAKGTAFGVADVYVCSSACGDVTDSHNVKLG